MVRDILVNPSFFIPDACLSAGLFLIRYPFLLTSLV